MTDNTNSVEQEELIVKSCRRLREGESVDQLIASAIQAEREKNTAPTDNGIPELDALCESFNSNEIDLTALVCRAWNTALSTGNKEERERVKAELIDKLRIEQHSIGAVDGYDYNSGIEYGLRKAIKIADDVLAAIDEEKGE